MDDLRDLEQMVKVLRSDVDMLVYRIKQVLVRCKALEVAIERRSNGDTDSPDSHTEG